MAIKKKYMAIPIPLSKIIKFSVKILYQTRYIWWWWFWVLMLLKNRLGLGKIMVSVWFFSFYLFFALLKTQTGLLKFFFFCVSIVFSKEKLDCRCYDTPKS